MRDRVSVGTSVGRHGVDVVVPVGPGAVCARRAGGADQQFDLPRRSRRSNGRQLHPERRSMAPATETCEPPLMGAAGGRRRALCLVLMLAPGCSGAAPRATAPIAPALSDSDGRPSPPASPAAVTSGAPSAAPSESNPAAATPETSNESPTNPSDTRSGKATFTAARGCLPLGETVVLQGVVTRPAPASLLASPTPKRRTKTGAPPSKPAWRFQLQPPRCVSPAFPGKKPAEVPVSTLFLMPIAGAAATYETFEGELVEATGVLLAISSGDQVHVLYVVREVSSATAAK